MKDEEKLETFKSRFRETAFKISGVPFEMPIVHIHQDTMPNHDDNVDSIVCALQCVVQRHQKQIDDEIIKNIRQIMKEKGISDYYSIDETRLLEIIEEARAFEIIKEKVIPYSLTNRTMISRAFEEGWITQEEFDILKRALL